MKRNLRFVGGVVAVLVCIAFASEAEARFGGGRSSGSRGSRGFGSRSFSSGPSRQQSGFGQFGNQQSNRPFGAPAAPSSPMGGTFTRGLMGGLAGGFIGSMLFRQMGYAGAGMPGAGSGGFGLLEIILLAGVGFIIFRLLANRRMAAANGYPSAYEKLRSVESGPYSSGAREAMSHTERAAQDSNDESAMARALRNFDLEEFKETRMDDFMKLQSAWNFRDLSSVSSMVEPEILTSLNADIERLKSERRINRIENIAVRNVQLVDAWQEFGKEFATLRFRANLVDYTVDETSGSVVSGDRVQPTKFEEDWTFVRDASNASPTSWKLTAIEN